MKNEKKFLEGFDRFHRELGRVLTQEKSPLEKIEGAAVEYRKLMDATGGDAPSKAAEQLLDELDLVLEQARVSDTDRQRYVDRLDALEAELREVLSRTRGNVAAAGRHYGKERMQVHRWLKRYGIDVNEYRY